MAIERKIVDGEVVLAVETEADFREAMETGLPIAAPKELGERMGWPGDDAA